VEKVLAHVSDPALRVRILPTASWLAWYLFTPGTRLIAKRYAEEGLAISRDTNDKRGEAICLGTLGQIAHHENQPETARQLHNQAVELSRDFTDTWLRGHCLRGLASVLLPQGYVEEAQAVMKQAVDELRQSGDRYAVAVVLREAGVVFASTHKRPLAKEYLQESIALSEQLRDNGNVGLASLVLGYCAGDAGEYAQARAYFDTALRSCRESGNRYGLAHALMNRAYTFLGENAPEGAARDLSESLHLFSEFGNGGDIAMALEAMARVALAQQNWKRVTTLFAAAVTLRASVGSTMLGDDVVRYENEVAQAKTYLCPDEYEVAYAHGASLSALQAVDYALQEPLLRASN
jgi:tetratricopeptide (TPR) repeat protein